MLCLQNLTSNNSKCITPIFVKLAEFKVFQTLYVYEKQLEYLDRQARYRELNMVPRSDNSHFYGGACG